MKALISAYDRAGVIEFAGKLVEAGFEIISTGGTRAELTAAGLPVTLLSDVTGFPEVLDGRVKTLHPIVHAGILARRDLDSHVAELSEHGIDGIDVVVGNLYPFVETVRKPDVSLEDALENIDIGGPTMIRAAAKNFPSVIVIVDPADFAWVGERILAGTNCGTIGDALTLEERKGLALKAFRHVAQYDAAVSRYLSNGDLLSGTDFAVGFEKIADMRYGENPHQKGSVYRDPLASGGIVNAERLHGIEMSFTNYLDAEAAWSAVTDFSEPAACIVKHLNPCGLSVHDDQPTAYRRALEGDPVSAYGGIVAYNRTLTAETAAFMRGVLYHVIVAPEYEPEALDILRRRKETRILKVGSTGGDLGGLDLRLVSGGALLQTADDIEEDPALWEGCHGARAHGTRACRPGLCMEGVQAHQVERHRARQGQHPRGHGDGAAEPGHQHQARHRDRGRQGQWKRAGIRRLHAVRRQHRGCLPGGGHLNSPAGRFDA